MKKLMLFFGLAVMLLYSSAAEAVIVKRIHRVEKGEYLIKIAKKYKMEYIWIARVNNLKRPYRIYVDQKLTIPFFWTFPAQNKYKGGCLVAKKPVNIRESLENQLGKRSQYKGKYSALIPVFLRRVARKDYRMKPIIPGEYFNSMDFTKDGQTITVISLFENWDKNYIRKNKITRRAERYIEKFGNEQVMFTIPLACCNPAITITPLPPPPPVLPPPVIPRAPSPPVEAPPTEVPPSEPPPAPPPQPLIPSAPLPESEPEKPPEEIKAHEEWPETPKQKWNKWSIEYETDLVGGSWNWIDGRLGRQKLKGDFFFMDTMLWYRQCEKCPLLLGLGPIVGYGDFEARFGKGWAKKFGLQGGFKLIEPRGEDGYRLWELTVRPIIYEEQRVLIGDQSPRLHSNREIYSGEIRIGLENKKTRKGIWPDRIGGYFVLGVPYSRKQSSNFKARNEGTSYVTAGPWVGWSLWESKSGAHRLELRATFAPFYHQWSEQTGISAGTTINYEGPIAIRIGPFADFHPFRKGSGTLVGWGVQIDLGNIMFEIPYREYMERRLIQSDSPDKDKSTKIQEKQTPENPGMIEKKIQNQEKESQSIERVSFTESSWPEDSGSKEAQKTTTLNGNESKENPEDNTGVQDFHCSLLGTC